MKTVTIEVPEAFWGMMSITLVGGMNTGSINLATCGFNLKAGSNIHFKDGKFYQTKEGGSDEN